MSATLRTLLIAFAVTLCLWSHAEGAKPTAYTAKLQEMRNSFMRQCARELVAVSGEAKTRLRCGCTFDVMAQNMTVAEWFEFNEAKSDLKRVEHLPQVARMRPLIQACAAGGGP